MDGNKSNSSSNNPSLPLRKENEIDDSKQRTEDKLDNLVKKWQRETREEIKKQGEAEFDFMSTDPSSLTERIKNHTREFVESQWAALSQLQKAKSILKQFTTKANPYNELLKDQPSLILKTRRVEYVFEKFRSLNL